MERSTYIHILVSAALTTVLAGCKQEAQSRNPQKIGKSTSNSQASSVIARVSQDPTNASMGKLELVATKQIVNKNSSPADVAKAFELGNQLGLKKDGMSLTASDPASGNIFALYECPPGYYMPYATQASQASAFQPNIGIDNIYSSLSSGNILGGLLGGLGSSSGGGIWESLTGSFQSLIGLFSGGNTGTVGVPVGQTASNYNNYGCVPINGTYPGTYPPVANNQWYPTTTTTATTTTPDPATTSSPTSGGQASPTAYPYIGQVQAGPYTYYTYAIPETNQSQAPVSN